MPRLFTYNSRHFTFKEAKGQMSSLLEEAQSLKEELDQLVHESVLLNSLEWQGASLWFQRGHFRIESKWSRSERRFAWDNFYISLNISTKKIRLYIEYVIKGAVKDDYKARRSVSTVSKALISQYLSVPWEKLQEDLSSLAVAKEL